LAARHVNPAKLRLKARGLTLQVAALTLAPHRPIEANPYPTDLKEHDMHNTPIALHAARG